jgi:hypothetical protein
MTYSYYAQATRAGLEFVNKEKNFSLCRAQNPGLAAHDDVSALIELTYFPAVPNSGYYTFQTVYDYTPGSLKYM